MIEFRDLRKSFGGRAVLAGLNLRVERGEVLFLIGTSGVGKSVAIKHLIGLVRPDQGEIYLDGSPIHAFGEDELRSVRMRCGMVFQNSTLFDSMTLLENVALPLRKHRALRGRAADEEALRRLAQVHMGAYAHRYPAELGDGMRKRAAIARTLALEPEYMLFDEPTTGLDPVSARRVDRLIRELKDGGVTSIVVSHDLVSIFAIADRIAMLYRGVVHICGTPAEIRASTDPVVQQFITGKSTGPMDTPGF